MSKSHSALENLSTQKISSLFWVYALPSIIGATVNPLYNIVNGVFIGHWIGEHALSATGAILPVMNLAAAVGMLVGVGSATWMSLYLGRGDHHKAERIVGTSFLLSLVLSSIVLGLLLCFLKPVLMFVGATEATYPYARDFLQIFLPGSIFLTLAFNYNSMMRATGFPIKAMITMFISVIANVILAPVFIYWLGWGMRGAAVATTISMAISFVFVMQHFINKNSPVRLRKRNIHLGWESTKVILSIGLSPFCMQVAASAVIVLINAQIHRYAGVAGVGVESAVAAFSNVNRLTMFIVMVVIGLNQGMQPIISYNYGAKYYERVRHTLLYAAVVATCVTTIGFVLAVFFPQWFVKAFTINESIIRLSATALRYVSLAFVVVGSQMVVTAYFQSIGKPKISIFLSLTRQLIFLVPLLVILPLFWGLDGVWIASSVSDILAFLTAMAMLRWHFRQIRLGH